MSLTLTLTPIGVIRTPFAERAVAPRQSVLAREVPGTLVLHGGSGFEHALEDIEGWEYLWVLYWFHANAAWRPKVLPPRSRKRRGVFSTRSPHRPNPIGMSVVRLERVAGLELHVTGVDMLDGTPLLDLKPYVAYADAFPGARAGWLEPDGAEVDPGPRYEVTWAALAAEQAAWLLTEHGVDLTPRISAALALGPEPHAYRRIRAHGAGMRLALKDWRVDFTVEGRRVTVRSIHTGYRPRQLATEEEGSAPAAHRAFVARFGLG